MGDLTLAYKVRSYSTGTRGRAICNARTHHFVADDSGGEEVGAGELFLSGISACAVNMVERLAHERQIPLQWMDVGVEAYRDPAKKPGNGADRCTVRSPWRPQTPPWNMTSTANLVRAKQGISLARVPGLKPLHPLARG
jgi:hypothetical protein